MTDKLKVEFKFSQNIIHSSFTKFRSISSSFNYYFDNVNNWLYHFMNIAQWNEQSHSWKRWTASSWLHIWFGFSIVITRFIFWIIWSRLLTLLSDNLETSANSFWCDNFYGFSKNLEVWIVDLLKFYMRCQTLVVRNLWLTLKNSVPR